MNNTNSSLNTIVVNDISAAGEILGYFVIPLTAAIGSFAYIFYGYILWKKKLIEQTKYTIIFCRIINVAIINLLFIGFQNNSCTYCPDRIYNTYLSQAYSKYSLKYVFHIFSMTQVVLDIFISYERFCILRNIQSDLFKISFKYIYIGLLILSTILRIPDYLSYEIKYSAVHAAYYIATTPIGNTLWYFYYKISFDLIYFGLCMITFSTFAIMNIVLYKKWANNKSKMVKDEKRIKRSEANFTKMVIISTIIETSAVLYNLIAFVIVSIFAFKGIVYNPFANLNQGISYEFILIGWIIDIYLYFSMDINLKNIFKKFFFWKKPTPNSQKYNSNTKSTTH